MLEHADHKMYVVKSVPKLPNVNTCDTTYRKQTAYSYIDEFAGCRVTTYNKVNIL